MQVPKRGYRQVGHLVRKFLSRRWRTIYALMGREVGAGFDSDASPALAVCGSFSSIVRPVQPGAYLLNHHTRSASNNALSSLIHFHVSLLPA